MDKRYRSVFSEVKYKATCSICGVAKYYDERHYERNHLNGGMRTACKVCLDKVKNAISQANRTLSETETSAAALRSPAMIVTNKDTHHECFSHCSPETVRFNLQRALCADIAGVHRGDS